VHTWTQQYAESIDRLERSREEVEPILPELVREQSIDELNLASGTSRVLTNLIDVVLFVVPLFIVSLFSECLPYFKVLKDSFGLGVIILVLVVLVVILYILVDAFWNYYTAQSVGARWMRNRLTVYPDYSNTYIQHFKRSFLKVVTAPILFSQLNNKNLITIQDRTTHIYREQIDSAD